MDIKNLAEADRTELYTIHQEGVDKVCIPKYWTQLVETYFQTGKRPLQAEWIRYPNNAEHHWKVSGDLSWTCKGNDQADRLVGKATIKSGLHFGRSEGWRSLVLRSLRHYLWAQSQGHYSLRYQSAGGQRCGKRSCFMIYPERIRQGHYQSGEH